MKRTNIFLKRIHQIIPCEVSRTVFSFRAKKALTTYAVPRKWSAKTIFLACMLSLPWTITAQAAEDSLRPDAVALDYGTGNATRLTRMNLRWDWSDAWFESNGTHVSGYWDASLATWNARAWHNVDGNDRTLTNIGFTPVFRFESDSRQGWYLDGGVGANVLSRLYENNRRNFSTAFQFGDLVGVGYQSAQWTAGVTLEHFSNGCVKHPNPGANFALFSIGYRFKID